MHDAMAIYELLVPDAIEKQGAHVVVETGGVHTRGETVIDRRRGYAASSTRVGVGLDNARFVAFLRERLARYPLG